MLRLLKVILMKGKWEKYILIKLIDIYEHRFHSGSTFKQKIVLYFDSTHFSEYTNPSNIDDPQLIEIAVANLERLKFIVVNREKYTELILKVSLVMASIDMVYDYVGTDRISGRYESFFEVFRAYDCCILAEYETYLLDRLKNQKTIKSYLLDYAIANDVFRSIQAIEDLKSDILIRNLSIQLFSDSKKLERLLPKIESVYKTVISDFKVEYFTEKGLLRNPSYLYFKGDQKITINNQLIDLSVVGNSIGINSELVDSIFMENIDKITTIENLTSFNNYKSTGLVVYLGGFSNHIMKKFLIKAIDSKAELYHFGDIDYGGFLILLDIYNYSGVLPKTIKMDIVSLKEKKEYCKDISTDIEYRRKLTSLLEKSPLSEHFETIKYMIENNVILEQEALDD